jgi:hypothetical protein
MSNPATLIDQLVDHFWYQVARVELSLTHGPNQLGQLNDCKMSQNSVKVGSSDTILVEMILSEELLQAESYWRIDHQDVMVTGSEEFDGLEATCVEVLEEFDIDEIVTVERITSLHDFEGRVDTFSLSDWESKRVKYIRISVTWNDSVVWEHV